MLYSKDIYVLKIPFESIIFISQLYSYLFLTTVYEICIFLEEGGGEISPERISHIVFHSSTLISTRGRIVAQEPILPDLIHAYI